MDETLIYLLVILGILLVPFLSILLNYYFEKKKLAAETEKIELQNKITKEITYGQLKSESKHKDIKNKIEILQRLNKLEEELKNKENKTKTDQKKLESLEMIKKEFGQTFISKENLPSEESTNLPEKQNDKETDNGKKIKSTNTVRQKKKKTKKKK
jgi:hypothetical protein